MSHQCVEKPNTYLSSVLSHFYWILLWQILWLILFYFELCEKINFMFKSVFSIYKTIVKIVTIIALKSFLYSDNFYNAHLLKSLQEFFIYIYIMLTDKRICLTFYNKMQTSILIYFSSVRMFIQNKFFIKIYIHLIFFLLDSWKRMLFSLENYVSSFKQYWINKEIKLKS